jgi:bud site selection protein 20
MTQLCIVHSASGMFMYGSTGLPTRRPSVQRPDFCSVEPAATGQHSATSCLGEVCRPTAPHNFGLQVRKFPFLILPSSSAVRIADSACAEEPHRPPITFVILRRCQHTFSPSSTARALSARPRPFTHMPAIRGAKSKKKTRRYTRDVDQVHADLTSPRHLERYLQSKAPEDLPALGNWYCVECAKWFDGELNYEAHKRGKPHKRRCVSLPWPIGTVHVF